MVKKFVFPIQAIIPAAGKPTNNIIPNTTFSDTMVPINGKPVVGYLIEDLIERGITDILLVLNASDIHAQEYVSKRFQNKCQLHIIKNKNTEKGIGHSLYLAAKVLDKNKQTFVYLGDTLYKGTLDFKKDFLIVSREYNEPEKWCFVEGNSDKLIFINKPTTYSGKGSILCGLYFFSDSIYLQKSLLSLERVKKKFEIKDILEKYNQKYPFRLMKAQKWYDCGNIENYYKARIDFLKVRRFNKITYNDMYGFITKSGSKKEKLLQEINWYLNTPNELKIFSPRLIDYDNTNGKVSYSLEFYGYPSLADLFVFNSLDRQVWEIIVRRLFAILALFKKYKSKIARMSYREMYIDKTKKRLAEMKKQAYWKELLQKEYVTINAKKYKNFSLLLPEIEKYMKKFYDEKEMTFIHGDLCMSNILFDPTSRIFKFVDPGGRFGETGVYGDSKYDVAKLRHSFSGYYDFIMSDLFQLHEKDFSYEFSIFNDILHNDIANYFDKILQKNQFDLVEIKIIEGLLFLSMIPLHADTTQRQKAMFCRGIEILNECFS